ncbi:MAG: TatD family hydrolase [Candidatus Tenebribacter burtonii]|jgi:TatD DNase family protein|nr:TatD family hydrolase [Candidatus Tenebribacter burtonii]
MKDFIDAHCHLADDRIASNLAEEITEAKKVGITHFISSALCQKEIEWHQNSSFPGMFWSAGIHPYYDESVEQDFEMMIKLCNAKEIIAIGEIGLDNRKDNFDWQKKILLMQLDLAKNYDLPVVFHTVKQYYELEKILKNNFPKVRGFLHAFNASQEIFEKFKKYDLGFSLNAKTPKDEVILAIIKHGFYFFETDAPYMRPRVLNENFNHLKNLIWIVKQISQKTNTNLEILKERQFNNFCDMFG